MFYQKLLRYVAIRYYDREVFQAEIRRIWEYLLLQGVNGNSPV